MCLADRDARLLYQQQLDAGALPPDAPPQPHSLMEVHRCGGGGGGGRRRCRRRGMRGEARGR